MDRWRKTIEFEGFFFFSCSSKVFCVVFVRGNTWRDRQIQVMSMRRSPLVRKKRLSRFTQLIIDIDEHELA